MIYELADTSKVEKLFENWEFLETAVAACLQKTGGKIYVTDTDAPRSAMAFCCSFAFFAGEPDRELVLGKPDCYVNMVPQNDEWARLIVSSFPAQKKARYALKKNAGFDRERLEAMAEALPEGYQIKKIDPAIYDICLEDDETEDLVCWFGPKEMFLEHGLGFVVLKDGKVVSGAASAIRYREGIEIEADTVRSERHKGLASAVCARLILSCLSEGLYPSWDASNWMSVMLAEKLGYEFDREYFVYGAR